MKVSLNWVRFINEKYRSAAEPAPDGVDKLVEKIGAQLGAVEEVVDIGKKYKGILIVKVISCDKHPNADKLSVCMIDTGKGKPIQVVCGAPNVKAGQLAVWIPPGVAVPSTIDKDPFVIEAREIRGVMSHGMLASAKELDLGDDHSGIVVVDKDVKPGASFAKEYGLDDYVIDIENKMFTHRPDLFGILGVAREIAGIQGHAFKSPDWYSLKARVPTSRARDDRKLAHKNELPKLVPRFCLLVMKDIKVGQSPLWLKSKLVRVGIRPINNIVDITNFYMHETAQPLHAYDYDKVLAQDPSAKQATINVRPGKKGEKLTLLGGKVIELNPDVIAIASATKAIGLGGVMGGADTEVDENTKTIILECGTFDMNTTRRTAMHYGLFTDAATRFTKGQSPLQNAVVITKAAEDVQRLAGGRVTGQLIDGNHVPSEVLRRGSVYPPVKVSREFINQRLGLDLSTAEMGRLLKNVEFEVDIKNDELTAKAPFWRTDIEIPEDVVEEVGRLYGYDHLPLELPDKDLTPAAIEPMLGFKSRVRDILTAAGANEVLTYSFVHGSLLQKVGQDPKKAYQISNAISPDLQYYRLSLTPSLLDKVHSNIRAGFDEFALFEIGKGHKKGLLDKEKVPKELERTSLVMAARKPKAGAAYFAAKKFLDHMFSELGIHNVKYEPLDPGGKYETVPYYEPARGANITVGGKVIGRIGEFKQSVRTALKLPEYCAGFDVHTDELLALALPPDYQPLPRYPYVEQDISLRVPERVSFGDIYDHLVKHLDKIKPANTTASLMPLDIYQKDSKQKHFAFRLEIASHERTLTAKEVNELLDELAKSAKVKFNAERL